MKLDSELRFNEKINSSGGHILLRFGALNEWESPKFHTNCSCSKRTEQYNISILS